MKILKRLLSMLKPHLISSILGLLFMMLFSGFDLVMPLIFKQTIDNGIVKHNLKIIGIYIAIMAGMIICRSVAAYFQGFFMERSSQKIAYDLRNKLYAHMQRLSFGFFDKLKTGQIMSRMTGDIECVRNFLGFGLVNLIMCFINFVVTIIIFFSINWKLAVFVLLPVPILVLVIVLFSRKINPVWEVIREQMGKLTAILQENISGIRAVKAFARETYEKGKFNTSNLNNYNENIRRARIESNTFSFMHLLGGLNFLLLTWMGGYFVIKGQISIGTFTALQWYIWGLIWPIRFSGWLVNIMQQALAAGPRIFEILDTAPEITNVENAGDMPQGKGHVILENVSYNFPDGQPALRNINLDVKPGEIIAIIGGTGSGKSTLTSLLPRFADPSEGRIIIDGTDIRNIRLESLRSRIGMVMQETFLFSDTIRENIAYGRPDASQEDIEQAAGIACISGFIESLHDRYLAKVGERGIGLSGGQKQRVAIARAVLMNPRILILDEATSSIDTATERAIQASMKEIMKNRTTFIIAQRLSTIKNAHRIIVMENGCIVETGTHQELADKGGYYSRIYEMQFKDQEVLESA